MPMNRVIYTVIVNGYDRLIEPPAYPGWDFVCFTDGIGLSWRARAGLSRWTIRRIDKSGLDPRRYSRHPKLLPHRYLADYDYSVYIDGNARLLQDPTGLVDALNSPRFGVGVHRFRSTVPEEMEECVRVGNADPAAAENQRQAYLQDGCPQNLPLLENNLLLRAHNDSDVIATNELWWEQLEQFTQRDQLGLPYAAWKTGLKITAFPTELKYSYFATKAHYRSVLSRFMKSVRKKFRGFSAT